MFQNIVRCGYRFVKLDFLATAMLEGERRHDPSVTRAEAMHRALSLIRETVGPETYLLAAGGPALLGTGILDIQRVSGDVAPYWRARYQPFLRDRAARRAYATAWRTSSPATSWAAGSSRETPTA